MIKHCSILVVFMMFIYSCHTSSAVLQKHEINDSAKEMPNIVWIVTEDISPTLSMYGDSTASTPALDRLASESTIYDNVYTVVGVCAPSRSAIITGKYPIRMGTMHMRTGKDVFSWGKREYKDKVDRNDIEGNPIREYSAVIPKDIKCFTEYLRAKGYYCTNNAKTDYQFAAPLSAWDENSGNAHWRHRPKGVPFFSVFNIGVTHESRLWVNENLPLTVDPLDVPVPEYLPDNLSTRHTIARNYSNIELMDKKVADILQQLKDDGLYDNTIVFFYSDHGGPLPRQKREIYDSGLHVPMIIKSIHSQDKGRSGRMISFVDLAPTILSLAGIKIPDYMDGKAFLGSQDIGNRQYIYASSDRFDEYTDRIRAIRDKRYLFLKNDYPELPKYKDVKYRKKIPMMKDFLKLKEEGALNEVQRMWFATKTKEELYDCKKDPQNIHNLIDMPEYADVLMRMRNKLKEIRSSENDYGMLPESKMIKKMWPDFQQPVTDAPKTKIVKKFITVECTTPGASISYLVSDQPISKLDRNAHWKLYTHAIKKEKGKYYNFVAERIGYKTSRIVSVY